MHRIEPASCAASRNLPSSGNKVTACAVTLLTFLIAVIPAPAHAEVGIGSFNDLHLGNWTGSGALEAHDEICVYRSDAPDYRITISGDGPGNSLVLTRDAASTIAYSAFFRGSSGGYVAMEANQGNTFCCADNSAEDCTGATNATFQIRISEAALRAARHGSYSGTITIELEPN